MVLPMSELFQATRQSPRKSPNTLFNSSLTSTVSVDELHKSIPFESIELRPQRVEKEVTFDEMETIFFYEAHDQEEYPTWYTQTELNRFAKTTVKKARQLRKTLSDSIQLGWSLYEITEKYDSLEVHDTCKEGLALLYEEVDGLVGLESVLFDTIDDGEERRSEIARAIQDARSDPYAGDEASACYEASYRISAPAQRWYQVLGEAQHKMLD